MTPAPAPCTRRDNLLRVLRGEEPAWVPFAPNFCQWFDHHLANNMLPDELQGCSDHIDAHLRLGTDICTRNFDAGYRTHDIRAQVTSHDSEEPLGKRSTRTVATPHGTLVSVWQEQRLITTVHQERYPVQSWAADGAAFRWWLDQVEATWDPQPFERMQRRIGDQGIAMLPMGCTPLKFLHHHFGLDGSCLFLADHPDEAQAVCDAYWAKLLPLLHQAAAHPLVTAVILMDNVDTPFYPPRQVRRYWAPYVAEAAALLARQGKFLFVHACGKLAALSHIFAETQVSGLEGISHAPLGDWTPAQAVACHPRFVCIGGFSPMEQRLPADQIRQIYDRYLPQVPRRRMVFSTACNTEIRTPFSSIRLMQDLVRAWGGTPTA